MYLMALTPPDYDFLNARLGISSPEDLLKAINELLSHTDLANKKKDFEHLLFTGRNADRILRFSSFAASRIS